MSAVAARALTRWSMLMRERIALVRGRAKKAAWNRLEAAGRAYVECAGSSPGLIGLACAAPLWAVQPDGDVVHCYAQLQQCLDELVEVGAVTPKRRENAEIACWSAVHGFALLVTDGPLRDAPQSVRDAGLDEIMRVVREGV